MLFGEILWSVGLLFISELLIEDVFIVLLFLVFLDFG